jgi:hypothetical protein
VQYDGRRREIVTLVSILPVPTDGGGFAFQAVAGDKRSQGATAGAALDALTAQLSSDDAGTLVVIQRFRPDEFFTAMQQQRLAELTEERRAAHNRGESLAAEKEAELRDLIEAELRGSAARAAALADKLGR